MSPILKGLETGDELKPIYQQRSKTVDERTITAGSRFVLSFRPKWTMARIRATSSHMGGRALA